MFWTIVFLFGLNCESKCKANIWIKYPWPLSKVVVENWLMKSLQSLYYFSSLSTIWLFIIRSWSSYRCKLPQVFHCITTTETTFSKSHLLNKSKVILSPSLFYRLLWIIREGEQTSIWTSLFFLLSNSCITKGSIMLPFIKHTRYNRYHKKQRN